MIVWLVMGCSAKEPVSKPTETSAEKTTAPPSPPWTLHATGVGELVPGALIPDSVYDREGKNFEELWAQPIRDLDEEDEYGQGLRDQEGYPTIRFEELDVVAKLTHSFILLGIWVGPSVRTDQGTGLGSTLSELEAAHGPVSQQNIPEPYHCVARVSELKHVHFLFEDHCDRLQPDTPSAAVYVGGYDDPDAQP